jgi:uncharacterized protein YlxW (UPF0749 family)
MNPLMTPLIAPLIAPLFAPLMAPLRAPLIAPFNCSLNCSLNCSFDCSLNCSQELRAQKRDWLEESKESAKRLHNLQDELRAVRAQHDKALGEIRQLMGELDATRTDLAQVIASECA